MRRDRKNLLLEAKRDAYWRNVKFDNQYASSYEDFLEEQAVEDRFYEYGCVTVTMTDDEIKERDSIIKKGREEYLKVLPYSTTLTSSKFTFVLERDKLINLIKSQIFFSDQLSVSTCRLMSCFEDKNLYTNFKSQVNFNIFSFKSILFAIQA